MSGKQKIAIFLCILYPFYYICCIEINTMKLCRNTLNT